MHAAYLSLQAASVQQPDECTFAAHAVSVMGLLHMLSQLWDCCTCCLNPGNMQWWGPGEQGRAGEGAGGSAGGGAKPLPPQTALFGAPAAGDHWLLHGSPPTPTGPTPMPGLTLCTILGLSLCI